MLALLRYMLACIIDVCILNASIVTVDASIDTIVTNIGTIDASMYDRC